MNIIFQYWNSEKIKILEYIEPDVLISRILWDHIFPEVVSQYYNNSVRIYYTQVYTISYTTVIVAHDNTNKGRIINKIHNEPHQILLLYIIL